MCMYIYIYMYANLFIYIYTVCIYIYIHTYLQYVSVFFRITRISGYYKAYVRVEEQQPTALKVRAEAQHFD